jgi:hypothetical protein
MKRSGFLAGGLAAVAAGCAHPGPTRPFDELDRSAEPLRSRFDEAKGKVRVVMLVSPT